MIGIKGHSYQGHHMGVVEVLHLQDFTHHTGEVIYCEETYRGNSSDEGSITTKDFTFQSLDSHQFKFNQCVHLKEMCSVHHSKFTFYIAYGMMWGRTSHYRTVWKECHMKERVS